MALSNIVIKDGSNTDQTFEVFTPQVGKEAAVLVNKVAGATIGFQRMNLVTRRTQAGKGGFVVQGSIAVPFNKAAVGEAPNWVTGHADFKVNIPDELAAADRATLGAYIKNLLANTQVSNAIANIISFA